jgi:hypothetical protein
MHWGFGVDVFNGEDSFVSVNWGGVHWVLGHATKNAFVGGGHAAFASLIDKILFG